HGSSGIAARVRGRREERGPAGGAGTRRVAVPALRAAAVHAGPNDLDGAGDVDGALAQIEQVSRPLLSEDGEGFRTCSGVEAEQGLHLRDGLAADAAESVRGDVGEVGSGKRGLVRPA